jgi:hypothetical protein
LAFPFFQQSLESGILPRIPKNVWNNDEWRL